MPTFYEDSNMFQLRSGNKSPLEFKQMGSSALHHTKIDGADHTKDGKGKHPGTYRAHNMERPEGYNEFGDPIKEAAPTKFIGLTAAKALGMQNKDESGNAGNQGGMWGLIASQAQQVGQSMGQNVQSANVPMHGDERHTGKTLAANKGAQELGMGDMGGVGNAALDFMKQQKQQEVV